MPSTVKEVEESFNSSPFFSFIGFEIINFEEENVLLKLPVRKELLNANGVLHGGVHASMLDTIMGAVIRSLTKNKCTTINMNINYLAPTSKGELFARARVMQKGHRIVAVEGELFEENKILIAKSLGTYRLIRD